MISNISEPYQRPGASGSLFFIWTDRYMAYGSDRILSVFVLLRLTFLIYYFFIILLISLKVGGSSCNGYLEIATAAQALANFTSSSSFMPIASA